MRASDISASDFKGLAFIQRAIVYRGRQPTFQAICDHLGFKSRRSAALLIGRLVERGYLARLPNGGLRVVKGTAEDASTERTIEIPLVGSAPCGVPLLALENVEALIPVSQKIARPGGTYFLLRATGNSMNEAGISDGDLVIVRQQPVANTGDRVVALIDEEVTIKEFRHGNDVVALVPRSSDKHHKPIILNRDFMIQGIVIAAMPYPID